MMIGTVIEVIDISEPYATKIKAYVSEILPMNTNSDTEPAEYKFSIKNENGEKEEVIIKNKGYVVCDYFNQISNRPHPPVVHPSEEVYVFQIGDPDVWWWMPINRKHNARSTEHLKIVIADRPMDQVGEPLTDDNTWFFEVDTRNKKLIHIHTSVSDEELVGYDITINPSDGVLSITDTKQNSLIWESATPRIYIKNNKGSIVDINKEHIIIDAPKDIWMKAGRQMVVDTPVITFDTPTAKFNSKNFGVDASTLFSVVSPSVGVDGPLMASGPVMTGAMFMGMGITPGTGPTLPPVKTSPGNSPEDNKGGEDETSAPPPTPTPSLANRFAADWANMKAAIDMIAIYCAGITIDPASFGGLSAVQKLTSAGKLPNITDELSE